MRNLFRCEMHKMIKSLPMKILFLLMLGFSVVTSISSLSYVDSPYAQEMEIALSGYDAFFVSLRDMPTIAIIGIIIVGILICSDFENRTIQSEIASGYTRSVILLSKILAFGIAYFIVLLPYPLGRAVLQGAFIQFGTMITPSVLLNMLLSYISIIFLGMAVNGVAIIFAFLFKKSIVVIGASLVLVVLGGNALLSFGISNPTFGEVLAKTPIGLFKILAIEHYDSSTLIQAILVSVVFVSVSVLLAFVYFRKAELK